MLDNHKVPDTPAGSGRGYRPARIDVVRIATVAVATLLLWLDLVLSPYDAALALAAMVGCGWPIFRHAFGALMARRMSMELSMTIALTAALVVGEYFSALVIVLFVLLAEEIEKATVFRGRRSIASLLDLLPATATVRSAGGSIVDKPVSGLIPGEVVVVRPGARIVVDGVVVDGHSFVDESTITGESFPVEKLSGQPVYAGTVNQAGALEVRTEKVGPETAFGRIIAAVEQAESSRAPVQKTADRLAGYLVYFALACAALTFIVTGDIMQTIAVIIVAGACGVAAGTPLALLGAIGRSARCGSIIKGALYVERLAAVDTVVFDKTGTLTRGTPVVVAVETVSGLSQEELLRLAVVAEARSEHPLARAIEKEALARGIERPSQSPNRFSYVPGRGVACLVGNSELLVGNRKHLEEQGVDTSGFPRADDTEVLVARSGVLLGRIRVTDAIRSGAAEAVAQLQRMGLQTILLSGDGQVAAGHVARQMGIKEFAGDLQPEDKRRYVARLAAKGASVAMVGDGINDAPALKEAAVGIAVGSGTDVAVESADVVLIGSDLGRVVDAIKIARQCRRVIWTNFIGTILVDAVGVTLAFLGALTPLLAAFVHVGSELAFLLNSARMFPLSRR